MDTRCLHVTAKGTQCKFKSKRNGYCLKHVKNEDTCPICFEAVHKNGMTLPCNHSFHKKCIMTWYVESDVCPVCREKQDDDIMDFKKKVEDKMRSIYKDAIESSDLEIRRLRRLVHHYRPSFLEPWTHPSGPTVGEIFSSFRSAADSSTSGNNTGA